MFRNWGVPIIAVLILLPVVYTSFYPDPGYPLKWAPRVVIGWLIVGVVYLVWRISTRQPVNIDYAFADIGEAIPAEALATEPHAESV